jgi:Mobilization protein NikA
MDLTQYVSGLRHELAVAAEAGGDDARALAERLTAPLESAVWLVLLDALSSAAAEITRDLAPGSVDLRLRGREPTFVVTPPAAEPAFGEPAIPAAAPPAVPEGEEGATARISFRLTEHLKSRIEEAAGQAGLSVNAWLVRAAAGALESGEPGGQPSRRVPWGGQHYTGWVS